MSNLETLRNILEAMPDAVVAVSGGVDSLTLGLIAHRARPLRIAMVHAISAAVPPEATERVETLAKLEGWRLTLLDAGELADTDYLSNPVNRCFYCKSKLFDAIRRLSAAHILTGANTDDLGEYRPGLKAAAAHDVRHPYIEANMNKNSVRELARSLGFETISQLPAGPCLASRVETGILIDPAILRAIHAAEQRVNAETHAAIVRVRLRADGLVVELDPAAVSVLDDSTRATLSRLILPMFEGHASSIAFAPYRVGSAFLVPANDRN